MTGLEVALGVVAVAVALAVRSVLTGEREIAVGSGARHEPSEARIREDDPTSSDPVVVPPAARDTMIELIVRLAMIDGSISPEEWTLLERAVGPEGPLLREVVARCGGTSYAVEEEQPAASYREAPRHARLDLPRLRVDLARLAATLTIRQKVRLRRAAGAVREAAFAGRAASDVEAIDALLAEVLS